MCAIITYNFYDKIVDNVSVYFRHLTYAVMVRAYGVVVSMFDIHRGDRGSNRGRGVKIS